VRTITRVNSSNELEYGWSANGPVKFMGGGSYAEKMRIHTNGYIGIDKQAPTEKLDVVGNVLASGNITGAGFKTSYNTLGQTSSGAMLILGHNAEVTGGVNIVQAKNTGYHSTFIKMYYNQGITFHSTTGTQTAGTELLNGTGANSLERMRMTNDGKLGIGCNPSYQLDVYGTDDITMRIHRPSSGLALTDTCGIGFSHRGDAAHSTSDTRAAIVSTYNGSLHLCTEPGGNLNSNPVDHAALSIIDTEQRVGIGTVTPSIKLDIYGPAGRVALAGGGTGSPLIFGSSDSNHVGEILQVMDKNNVQRLHMSNAGDMGVSTDAPAARLDVKSAGGGYELTTRTSDASNNETSWTMGGGGFGVRYGPAAVGVSSAQYTANSGETSRGQEKLQVQGPVGSGYGGRYVHEWWGPQITSNSGAYYHITTDLWGGGSPSGNVDFIMGGFKIIGYNYSPAQNIDALHQFHNWSGTIHQLAVTENGTVTGSAHTHVYVDSNGYVTLRLGSGIYKMFTVDFIEYSLYPKRAVKITATTVSNSTTL